MGSWQHRLCHPWRLRPCPRGASTFPWPSNRQLAEEAVPRAAAAKASARRRRARRGPTTPSAADAVGPRISLPSRQRLAARVQLLRDCRQYDSYEAVPYPSVVQASVDEVRLVGLVRIYLISFSRMYRPAQPLVQKTLGIWRGAGLALYSVAGASNACEGISTRG